MIVGVELGVIMIGFCGSGVDRQRRAGADPARTDPAYPAAERWRAGQRTVRCLLCARHRLGARHRGRTASAGDRPRQAEAGQGSRAAGHHLAGVATAPPVPAAAGRAGRHGRGAVRRGCAGDERADPGLRRAGPVRRDDPAARRAAGADPDRRPGPLLPVLARPAQTGLDHGAGGPGRDLGRRRQRSVHRFRRGIAAPQRRRRLDDWLWRRRDRAARRGPLDLGEGRRLRRADGLQRRRCLPARALPQPFPRLRRLPDRDAAPGSGRLTLVVAGHRRHRRPASC